MFRRLLVPLDTSPEGEAILPEILRIASPSTEFVLLHVLPAATPAVGAPPTEILVRGERAREYLERIARRIGRSGTKTVIRAGDAVKEILAVCDEVGADAIAMATHGRRGLSRLLVGSVAESVLKKSPRPILFTRPRAGKPNEPIRKILVALEGPDYHPRSLDPVRKLAAENGAEIVLLEIIEPVVVPQPVAGAMPIVPLPQPDQPDPKLERLADRLRSEGLKARTLIVHGYATAEITAQAKELDVDLVVMDKETRRGLDRLISAPVSKNLLRRLDRALLLCPKSAA